MSIEDLLQKMLQSELDTKAEMYIDALEDGVFKEQAPQYFKELPAE